MAGESRQWDHTHKHTSSPSPKDPFAWPPPQSRTGFFAMPRKACNESSIVTPSPWRRRTGLERRPPQRTNQDTRCNRQGPRDPSTCGFGQRRLILSITRNLAPHWIDEDRLAMRDMGSEEFWGTSRPGLSRAVKGWWVGATWTGRSVIQGQRTRSPSLETD